jgi:NitT/TauT family transport system ATP-binding protein
MLVEISGLTHTFATRPPRPAVANLAVRIPSGQFVGVVGPSGCGKSTFLRLIAGLLQPKAGHIFLDGQPPSQAANGQRVAWMAQSPALLPWLTAHANVALAQRFLPPGQARLTPEEALARVGLLDSAGAYPFMLSGGMQQRLALARLLTLPARLWLMDEPFAALDELTRERLAAELLTLWEPMRPTVLWVTHNLYEAVRLADRVLVFSQRPARLICDLAIDLPRPRDEFSPDFQTCLRALRQAVAQIG